MDRSERPPGDAMWALALAVQAAAGVKGKRKRQVGVRASIV
jgi:hypothetical protein